MVVVIDRSSDQVRSSAPHSIALRPRQFGLRTPPDRKGEHPQRHLKEFRGWLQADAYAGFNQLYKEDSGIQEVACWAHVRRKFYDLEQAHALPIASEALERTAALYAIEKEIRGRPADERQQVRATRARPLLQSLREWFEVSLTKLSRKSGTWDQKKDSAYLTHIVRRVATTRLLFQDFRLPTLSPTG